jgi:hypothetical protein
MRANLLACWKVELFLRDSNRLAIFDSLLPGRLVPSLKPELLATKNHQEAAAFPKVSVPPDPNLAR